MNKVTYMHNMSLINLICKVIQQYLNKSHLRHKWVKDKDKWVDRDCILIINKKKIAWNRYRRRKITLRYGTIVE